MLCADDKDILGLIKKVNNRRIVTFGLNEGADLRAKNIVYKNNNTEFDIEFLDGSRHIKNLNFPMVGEHNILNVLAAVAVARHLRVEDSDIRKGLMEFKGVGRRFTNLGTFKNVTIIDDYAHHPTEIKATLKAAKQSSNGRVLAVHQPHRFSRLSNLFNEFSNCFDDADIIGITPIFAAGENIIAGVTSEKLISRLSVNYSNPVIKIEDEKSLLSFVITHAKPNDIVVLMGAGSISSWANNLVVELT